MDNKDTINAFHNEEASIDSSKLCRNCGAKIEQGKPFCGNCGQSTGEDCAEEQSNRENIESSQLSSKKKNTKTIIGVIVAVLFAFMVIGGIAEKAAQNNRADRQKEELDKLYENFNITQKTEQNSYSSGLPYSKGVLTDTSYESMFADLMFSVPEGWSMMTNEEIQSQIGVDTDQYSYEMACVDAEWQRIIVAAEKLPSANTTVEQYMNSVLNSAGEFTKISDNKTRNIGGSVYQLLECSNTTQNVNTNVDLYIRKINDRVICIMAIYLPENKEEIETVLDCFTDYTFTFEGIDEK